MHSIHSPLANIRSPSLTSLSRVFFRFPDIASKHTRARQSAFVAKKHKPIEFLKQPVISEEICKDVIANVNEKLNDGRLYAVVQLLGKQFKVTDGDILLLEGYWAPTTGDKLKLEKVIAWSVCDVVRILLYIIPCVIATGSTRCR